MKIKTDSTTEATLEDENGLEWLVKIHYNYQPFESAEYGKDGNMEYPGCYSSVEVDAVERMESILIMGAGDVGSDWVLFTGATDKEEAAWAVEIHEAINQQFIDNRGEE